MHLSPQERALLASVSRFETIGRYQGLMPGKHLVTFGQDLTARLERLGLIEEVELTYNCGKTLKAVRLTPQGRLEIEDEQHPQGADDPAELTLEHLVLLQDVLHFSHMPRYRFMLPAKKAKIYNQEDLNDLFVRGYLLKLKVSTDDRGAAKGYVISAKGEKVLSEAGFS
ncbi:hypothetical protein JCM15519_14560 [Fundidesulfovibrio butyratiphilus]